MSSRKSWNRKTYDEIIASVNIGESLCKILTTKEEYINEDMNSESKLRFLCSCGNKFERSATNFNKSQKCCSDCMTYRKKWNYEKVVNYADSKGCKILTPENKYINLRHAITIECKCGNIFDRQFRTFVFDSLYYCDDCKRESMSSRHRYNIKKVYQDVVNINYKIIKFLEPYKNRNSMFLVQCDNGHIYKTFYGNLIYQGRRCPICKESKGERKIREVLSKNKISFIPEYSFSGLDGIGGQPLRFDFAIFNVDDKLIKLIEYDGIFHYEKQYDDDNFKTVQIHDKRKNQYCTDNNIPLIRIPYWDFNNIGILLQNELPMKEGVLSECC